MIVYYRAVSVYPIRIMHHVI